jgi:hypothetical protein
MTGAQPSRLPSSQWRHTVFALRAHCKRLERNRPGRRRRISDLLFALRAHCKRGRFRSSRACKRDACAPVIALQSLHFTSNFTV